MTPDQMPGGGPGPAAVRRQAFRRSSNGPSISKPKDSWSETRLDQGASGRLSSITWNRRHRIETDEGMCPKSESDARLTPETPAASALYSQ